MSDREIREAVRAGAMDAHALAERCGAGSSCGGCQPAVDALLAEAGVAIRSTIAA